MRPNRTKNGSQEPVLVRFGFGFFWFRELDFKTLVGGVGVHVSGGVCGDPMGSCDGIFRLVLTIQACSRSDNFLESRRITRYLAHCFSHCSRCSVCQIDWKIWLSKRILVYAVRSLLVRLIAMAISSRRCRAFIQYFRLMYR
jgi:hypothetical protein